MNQGHRPLLSTEPVPDAATHLMWTITGLSIPAWALSSGNLEGGEGGSSNVRLSELRSREVPDTWYCFPTTDTPPAPCNHIIKLLINQSINQSEMSYLGVVTVNFWLPFCTHRLHFIQVALHSDSFLITSLSCALSPQLKQYTWEAW